MEYLTLKDIFEVVCSATGLDISSNCRRSEYVYSRMVYYKIARANTNRKLSPIGEMVNRSHAQVLHGLKRWQFDVLEDNNEQLYLYCLEILGLKTDTEKILSEIERKKIANLDSLQLSVLRELKELSYTELLEFMETRLKPYKNGLRSRIEYKTIPHVSGALINR